MAKYQYPNTQEQELERISMQSLLEPGKEPASKPQLVTAFTWHAVEVTVSDRTTGQPKNILTNVSGQARAGEMMALMGPSGSGKTTLLNVLAQRYPTSVKGRVCINGSEQPLSIHRTVGAYVEQDDTLIGSMSTKETLKFAADLTISKSTSKQAINTRVNSLINDFGLTNQSNTLIGTPFRKGLSGGQKRRVSVASQLITEPSILFLDEPTSGLDSTASYEIMAFIKAFAIRHQLVVIASIHQPSTTTFDLFDQVTLLSQGRVCFCGKRMDMPNFFAEIDLEIPPMMNPAEYLLDLVNTDFATAQPAQERLDSVVQQWQKSRLNRELIANIVTTPTTPSTHLKVVASRSTSKPRVTKQIITLLHRSFIKSYRDITPYWVRVVMYMGLAFMMGTVWLRLSTDQNHIQPFINGIFFGSAFMSFMAVAYVPAFLEDRAVFVKERANGLYGATVFVLSNFIIGVPYLFLISVLFSVVAYWLGNFNPAADSFFTWILWLFLDLLAAESLVVLVSCIFPNFVGALAITAFANGLWMSVGGFLVPLPVLNVFWKYAFHYWDYQTYVFQGMMVSEFKNRLYQCNAFDATGQCHCMYSSSLQEQCLIPGTTVLDQYGYSIHQEGEWLGITVAIIIGYRLAGWLVTFLRKS